MIIPNTTSVRLLHFSLNDDTNQLIPTYYPVVGWYLHEKNVVEPIPAVAELRYLDYWGLESADGTIVDSYGDPYPDKVEFLRNIKLRIAAEVK